MKLIFEREKIEKPTHERAATKYNAVLKTDRCTHASIPIGTITPHYYTSPKVGTQWLFSRENIHYRNDSLEEAKAEFEKVITEEVRRNNR